MVTQNLTVDTGTSVAITSPAFTNDSTPVIAGVGEPGAAIELVVDGQTLVTTVAPDGIWSVLVVDALADGSHPVTVTSTDAVGFTATTAQSLTVDATTTVTLVPPGATDNPTPTLTGTGEPDATIELTVGGQTLTGAVDGSGSWSIGVPVALADGGYTVTVTATDPVGNVDSDTGPLTVDTRTTVGVTSPPLTTVPSPTITGTGEPGAAVRVTIGAQVVTAIVGVGGTWSVDVPIALADGGHSVSVTAVDALGNTAATTQQLTVDSTTAVTISSPALTSDATPIISGSGEPGSTIALVVGGQSLSGVVDGTGSWSIAVPVALGNGTYPVSVESTDLAGNTASTSQDLTVDSQTFVAVSSPSLTTDSTPVISGTGEPGSSVSVSVGGQSLTVTVAPDGTWSVTVPSALGDASYPVSILATDALGNTATAVQNLTVDTGTTVAISSPSATTDPTPNLSGSGEPGSTIALVVGGQALSGVVDGTGSWSIAVPAALADGTYPVSVTATDLAGNTASATQDLTVDTQTFVAIDTAPVTMSSTPTIGGTGEPGATISVSVDGQTLTATVAIDGSWSIDVLVALDDDTYPVSVTATDSLGNTATTVQNLTVDSGTTIAITSADATDNRTPTVSGSGEPGSTIALVVDGQTLSGVVDGTGSWSIAVPVALDDGTYPVSVTATDLAGNTASTTQDLTIDSQTVVAITTAASTSSSTPTIGGTGEPGATISVSVDGQTLTATVAIDGTWSTSVPVALDDDTYPVSVTATDSLGNTANSGARPDRRHDHVRHRHQPRGDQRRHTSNCRNGRARLHDLGAG